MIFWGKHDLIDFVDPSLDLNGCGVLEKFSVSLGYQFQEWDAFDACAAIILESTCVSMMDGKLVQAIVPRYHDYL